MALIIAADVVDNDSYIIIKFIFVVLLCETNRLLSLSCNLVNISVVRTRSL